MPQANVSLKDCNTLALDVSSRWYVEACSMPALLEALEFARSRDLPVLILGGGSNVILTRDHPGLCIRLALKGIELLEKSTSHARVRVACGEQWHPFVTTCLEREWYGLENLALIPGSVGACPIQNVGAYGVEVGQFIESVEVLDRASLETRKLSAVECRFGYRDSYFKREGKDRYIITAVIFRLRRQPALQLAYGPLAQLVEQDPRSGRPDKAAWALFDAVCHLRREKLPDPALLPNVGSFFKNPVVSLVAYEELALQYPDIVAYPEAEGAMKLAAGWLIDRAGWKGCRDGEVGVHERQALVLVNHGQATGESVMALAARVAASVEQRFGVALEVEPRIY